MRKLLTSFLLLLALSAKTQIGYEDFYSEKDLLTNLQQAKTLMVKLDATGCLAVHYKKLYKDSIGNVYLKKVYAIAENSENAELMARALWWDNYYDEGVEKATKHLTYAEQHNLRQEEISAHLALSDIYIHKDLSLAEQNALSAQNLLNSWRKDTLEKDSMLLEVSYRLAHAYIHKKDGVKTFRYMLVFRDYAEQKKNPALRIQAIMDLGWLYFEWEGQEEKASPWLKEAYAYFKSTGQYNMMLSLAVTLANQYSKINDKEQAKKYFGEADKLQDSLNAFSFSQLDLLWSKQGIGLISAKQFIQALDNDFNGHLYLPAALKADQKAQFYVEVTQQFDSAWKYITMAKNLGSDTKVILIFYYEKRKDYGKLIPALLELSESKEKGNLAEASWLYEKLGHAYNEQKEYKAAYKYLNKADILRDSLDKLRSEGELANMEMQKQQELQEAALNEQKRQQEEEKRRIEFQNDVRLYSLLAGLAILILITAILLHNNRRKQKDKLKIEHAFNELKLTQAQLIQSEKMASLGELTAGIAHEIQNPLNFVNNFSEVNKELLEELEGERSKVRSERDEQLENDIIKDIKENEEKINHHGKRADAIVKGMLQHSKASSGKKEPTNINALADEYLRLAYHGLRAKGKSFNAEIRTDFDDSIGKINVVPQDIGRVLLNLFNNAFYAVNRSPHPLKGSSNYEPTVSISTKRLDGKILISVKDNGPGIPQNIVDKIFQPFFTTKPTGQGTGLGLSLAYDIIKAHGGEIKLETKEGEGSEFVIQLPLNKES
jgi:signal transduction histidine kinase